MEENFFIIELWNKADLIPIMIKKNYSEDMFDNVWSLDLLDQTDIGYLLKI